MPEPPPRTLTPWGLLGGGLASCCQGWLWGRFIFLRSLAGWMFSSQADLPIHNNHGFTMGILTCSAKRRFRSEDGLGNALGLPRGPLGTSRANIGGSLGPLNRPNQVTRFILELEWASYARFLLPKMASGPKQMAFRCHREASGDEWRWVC